MEPKYSPWGEVQKCEALLPDVYKVVTAGHGGIMFTSSAAHEHLSRSALRCGLRANGYICYDEDMSVGIAYAELAKNNLYPIPNDYIQEHGKDAKPIFIKEMAEWAQRYYPDYDGVTEHKRFIAHDFLIGSPVLIDRTAKTMTFYRANCNGAIYNLRNPDCMAVDNKVKQAFIRRTKGDYTPKSRKVVDTYIFAYLMTPEERAKCFHKPYEPTDIKIVETDNFHEAVTAMCGWAYDYEHDGTESTVDDRTSALRYCEDFLKENPSPPKPNQKERGDEAR